MRTHTRLLLGALTAAIVLATAIGTASAQRLSISNRNFRQAWRALTFSTGAEAEGVTIGCDVTLEGSFHYNTIAKRLGALLGYVTKATVGHPCSGSGEAWANNGIEESRLGGTIPNSLPWHITYEGFQGRLPEITAVRLLLRPRFTLRAPIAGLCGYEGNAEGVVTIGRGGAAGAILPDERVGIGKISGGIFCPSQGFFRDTAEKSTLTLLGTTQIISITLI
jgi:hypothetical protein